MRALIQRVTQASVTVAGETVGEIGCGLLVLLGVTQTDSVKEVRWLADKIATLRIFEDEAGKFNLSVLDVGGQALVVSQFTLYADTRRGRRPDFIAAARPEVAEPLIEQFCDHLRAHGIRVATGRFQAHMFVHLTNDGPVTLQIDSPAA